LALAKNAVKTKKSYTLTYALLQAAASVLFCWFYGIVGLFMGINALRKILPRLKKGSLKQKSANKLRWTLWLSITGIALSGFFTIYYITCLFYGAYISLW
jgi:small-conductance mechanosensitive channel